MTNTLPQKVRNPMAKTLQERINDALKAAHVACFRSIFGDKVKFNTPAAAGWACPWNESAFLVVAPSGRSYESDGVKTIPVGDLIDAYCRSIGRSRNDSNQQSIFRFIADEIGA